MQPILEMRSITKTFPGVKALTDVNLAVLPAEIHAVVGENGAGKSTLMKVLSGVYPHGSYDGVTYQCLPVGFHGPMKCGLSALSSSAARSRFRALFRPCSKSTECVGWPQLLL